ncbi:tetratricopeptide repeat protein [Sinimarinibacterium sp. CAU 1509]|uniref:tetratricopeptide repeat protein n=1 Tax=Sinimarinibacterium sp. CAU 1509 TaxID=2562283 RepID=UPI001B7FA5F3|nr:tetratricopeptide repeat protein [Sinimarinibacterium sp. CAU 1509]
MTASTERTAMMNIHTTAPLPPALKIAAALLALTLGACSSMSGPKLPERPQPSAETGEVDKGDPQARFTEAMGLWQQNQNAEAETAFDSLSRDFPDFAGPWTNLGILYAKSNRREQAIAALSKAATLNPNNKVAFNWLGILYRESGDLNRAQLAYEKALAIDPNYALAHYNLGVLLDAHLKRPLDAVAHYRAYQSLHGTDDLRVMAWIAAIDAASTPPAPAPAPPKPEQTP